VNDNPKPGGTEGAGAGSGGEANGLPRAARAGAAGAQPRKLLLKAALGLIITGALILFLFRYIDLDQLGRMLAEMSWLYYFLGLASWVVVYLIRTFRYIIIAPRTPYATMLSITSIHNLLLRLLPLRTGELSYAFLVRRAGTAGLGESLLGLLLLRAVDATCVVVVFSVTLALHSGVYMADRRLGIGAAAVAALMGGVVVCFMGQLLRLGLRVARAILRGVGLTRRPGVQRALSKVDESVAAVAAIRGSATLKIAGISFVQWLLTFGGFFVIMRAFSMPVGIAQTVLGSTAAVVTGFLPIGGIGSFGTLEAGWALGFVLVGLDRERAVASGFGVSITTFTYAAVLGLFGWIGLWLINKRKL
jgi:uncharacterized membrane protein YbhN (UPF0104 family)